MPLKRPADAYAGNPTARHLSNSDLSADNRRAPIALPGKASRKETELFEYICELNIHLQQRHAHAILILAQNYALVEDLNGKMAKWGYHVVAPNGDMKESPWTKIYFRAIGVVEKMERNLGISFRAQRELLLQEEKKVTGETLEQPARGEHGQAKRIPSLRVA